MSCFPDRFLPKDIASEDEQDIILRYRQLSKKGKRIFLGMMEKMEEEKTE